MENWGGDLQGEPIFCLQGSAETLRAIDQAAWCRESRKAGIRRQSSKGVTFGESSQVPQPLGYAGSARILLC